MTDLLSRNHFALPTFQRPYVWGQKEIAELIDDLSLFLDSSQSDYFLGLISLEASGQDRQNIIDGQQRLISFSLLCSALHRLATTRNFNLTQQNREIQQSFTTLANSCADAGSEPRITFVEADAHEIYRNLMNVDAPLTGPVPLDDETITIEDEEEDDPQLGRTGKTLEKAFELVQEGVATMFPVGVLGESKYFQSIDKLVKHVLVVVLPLPPGQEALMVFNKMNNRGRQLSDDEKVKTVFSVEAQRDTGTSEALMEAIKDRWIVSTNDLSRLKFRKLRPFSLVLKALSRIEVHLISNEWNSRDRSQEPLAINPSPSLPTTRMDLYEQWQKVLDYRRANGSSLDEIQFHLENIHKATWLTINLARGRLTTNDPDRSRGVPKNRMVLHASRMLNTTQQMPLALMAGVRLSWTEQGQKALLWALDRRVLLSVMSRERGQYLEAELEEWVQQLAASPSGNLQGEIETVRRCIAQTSPERIALAQAELRTWQWSTTTHRKRIRALLACLYFDKYTQREVNARPLEDLMRGREYELDHIFPRSQENDDNRNWIHGLGNLTILEGVENGNQRDALPESPVKQENLRRSQVGSENQEIADIARNSGVWGETQSTNRIEALSVRLEAFFTRDLPQTLATSS